MDYLKRIVLPTLTGAFIILYAQPYFVWSLNNTIYRYIFTLCLLTMFWGHIKVLKNTELMLFFYFLLTLFLLAVLTGSNIFGALPIILLGAIPFASSLFLKRSYLVFYNLYAILISISLIVMLIVTSGVSVPNNIIPPLNTLKFYNYLAYPFWVVPMNMEPPLVFGVGRFCGIFDEPGVIGTLSVLILFIEKYNLKKWQNIAVLLSALISFSLFFYIMSMLYLIYYVSVKNSKKFYRIIVFFMTIFLLVLSFENSAVSNYIWGRLKYDTERSTIVGDNRADTDLVEFIREIRGTKLYFFGLGLYDKELLRSFDGSAGYRNAILRYGVFGITLYVLFFIIYANSKIGHNHLYYLFLLLLFLTLFQRPAFLHVHYIFLFVVFVEANKKSQLFHRNLAKKYFDNSK